MQRRKGFNFLCYFAYSNCPTDSHSLAIQRHDLPKNWNFSGTHQYLRLYKIHWTWQQMGWQKHYLHDIVGPGWVRGTVLILSRHVFNLFSNPEIQEFKINACMYPFSSALSSIAREAESNSSAWIPYFCHNIFATVFSSFNLAYMGNMQWNSKHCWYTGVNLKHEMIIFQYWKRGLERREILPKGWLGSFSSTPRIKV